jgi:hypothetical protein
MPTLRQRLLIANLLAFAAISGIGVRARDKLRLRDDRSGGITTPDD